MTQTAYRYENGKPVGLDWTVHNDGTSNPEAWKRPAPEPKEDKPKSGERGGYQPHKISPEVEESVLSLYRLGLSIPAIRKQHPMSNKTIYRILDRHGVERRHTTRPVTA